jgi:hypothetical protein
MFFHEKFFGKNESRFLLLKADLIMQFPQKKISKNDSSKN